MGIFSRTSVNYHLTEACNMRCGYCFAKYDLDDKKHLTLQESLRLIEEVAANGAKKLTFVGGEPMLCPWIGKITRHAKSLGLTTMMVTNGTLIDDCFLTEMRGYLDWIGISVNSLDVCSLKLIGAQCRNMEVNGDFYYRLVARVKSYGYRLKINTVVCNINKDEDLSDFIGFAKPERWKVFQVFPITEESRGFVISKDEFLDFCSRHSATVGGIVDMVPEDNDMMTESYMMIDPIGRFHDNGSGTLRYSDPILDAGFENALAQVTVREGRFVERGAIYDW